VQVAQRRELLNSVHSVFVSLVPIDVSIVYSKNRRISRSSIKIYILLSDGLERDVEADSGGAQKIKNSRLVISAKTKNFAPPLGCIDIQLATQLEL
jgi:hypothetical protein